MLKLTYVDDPAGPNGTASGSLRDSDNALLQAFPADQNAYAPPADALTRSVRDWLTRRGDQSDPVVVMVHGFDYDPGKPPTDPGNPFDSVYGYPPGVLYRLSWLPLVGECDKDGARRAENAVAFSYKTIGSLAEVGNEGWENIYQHAAFDLAPRAARALATILGALMNRAKLVRVLAHSLGTRTTTQAIRIARARLTSNLDRIVLLDGAEYCVDAAAAFAGCEFDVFNIVNGQDSVLVLGENFSAPIRPAGTLSACMIGREGLGANDRWLDLQLDNGKLINWLAAGHAPDGDRYAIDAKAEESSHALAGMDHWACYTNDGNRSFVRDLIASDVMTVALMKRFRVPDGTNAQSRGTFNHQPIPLTPRTRAERQRSWAPGAGGVAG